MSARPGIAALLVVGAIAWGTQLLSPRTLETRRTAASGAARQPDAAGALLQELPVAFVPNLGQWDHPARYAARFGAATVLLEDDGLWLDLPQRPAGGADAGAPRQARRAPSAPQPARGVALRLRLAGATPAELAPEQPLAGTHGYYLGDDPARWRAGVPRYGAVRYRGAYPGVDMRVYAKDGHLEYDLELAPGADLAQIEIEVEGAERLRVDPDGALVLETAVGAVRQPSPHTWEVGSGGERRAVACRYELRSEDRFGFEAREWSRETALVVDPGLIWSTFVGGSGPDGTAGLVVDASGVVTIAGGTGSTDYPTTPGAWSTATNGGGDVFVARLDPSLPTGQQLVYSTFVGGSSSESATALAVDAAGVVTVAGWTRSPSYPTTNGAWDTSHNGTYDVFVTRLDPLLPAPRQLVYSTFVGSAIDEFPWAVSVDNGGIVTVAGDAGAGYPTTSGAWNTTANGMSDIFVTQLDPSLPAAQQLVYSTFLGGSDLDSTGAISVAASGVITVAGGTQSADYPSTPNAWRTVGGVLVSQLDPSLPAAQQLVYSLLYGGATDAAAALWVDAAGVVTIGGATILSNFPTTPNAFDRRYSGGGLGGGGDAFVSRFDPSLPPAQQLLYSTFLGHKVSDWVDDVSVDAGGVITVAGGTRSPGFPTTNGAWDTTHNGILDAFVTRLDPSRSGAQQLVYSTFLGGSSYERVAGLAVDAAGVATIAGSTQSPGFPTTSGAWDTTHNGSNDAFVTRLHLLPDGTRTYGASTPGCTGVLSIGAPSQPQVGNPSFAVTGSAAPPSAPGALVIGTAARTTPIVVLGAAIWTDPFGTIPASSGPDGAARLPMPIPANPWLASKVFHAQWLWVGPTSPPPCPPSGISASNALEVTIQP